MYTTFSIAASVASQTQMCMPAPTCGADQFQYIHILTLNNPSSSISVLSLGYNAFFLVVNCWLDFTVLPMVFASFVMISSNHQHFALAVYAPRPQLHTCSTLETKYA